MRKLLLVIVAAVSALLAPARTVDLVTDSAACRVDLDGARITSLRIAGEETLWNDVPPQTNAADWAHGGIALCWPRFGVDSSGAIHGVAWRRTFAVKTANHTPKRSEIALSLQEGSIRLDYSIVLTDSLALSMTTTNVGTNESAFSCGFHPYLLVSERDATTVDGLDALSFEDDPSRPKPERGTWRGILEIKSSVDRIFRLPSDEKFSAEIRDAGSARAISLGCEGASDVNVWNPGQEKLCPGVVPGDSWRRFVCVEPILVGGADGRPVPMPPGASRTIGMTLAVKRITK